MAIIKNKAKCLSCNQEIESKYTHNFVTCKCGNLSVDGGKEYLKRVYSSEDTYLEMSEEK